MKTLGTTDSIQGMGNAYMDSHFTEVCLGHYIMLVRIRERICSCCTIMAHFNSKVILTVMSLILSYSKGYILVLVYCKEPGSVIALWAME